MAGENIILKKAGFYKVFQEKLYITRKKETLIDECHENLITLYLNGISKDKITIDDLKRYIKDVISFKNHEARKKRISHTLIFRVWHDIPSNWLRYTFLSKHIEELEAHHAKTEDLEFVNNVEDVLEAFLNERDDGCYEIIDGVKRFREYLSFFIKERRWKIYEEEIKPIELKVIDRN